MLLMIDNYDSFTYNLVQYLGELGQEVRVEGNDQITLADIAYPARTPACAGVTAFSSPPRLYWTDNFSGWVESNAKALLKVFS